MKQLKITNTITQRDSESINKYIADVAHTDLISPEEEVRLAERIQAGDQAAMSKLINANLRFVISVAKKYQSSGIELSDLIQEGNIGLITAAHKYDSTKGFKFISYAVWWIRQNIMQYISDHAGIVRLPSNQVTLMGKITKASNAYLQENGTLPTADILSKMLNEPESKIADVMNINVHGLSIDSPMGDNEDNSNYSDLMESNTADTDDHVEKEGLTVELSKILSTMGRTGEVLKQIYGIGCSALSMDEIGQQMDLSRERVRQIKENGLRTIRRHKDYILALKAYC